MRTIIVITIIGLVVCGTVIASEEKTDGKAEDLLKKAGQQVLNDYEERLNKLSEDIDVYIKEISSDGVVSGKEMLGLEKKIDSFLDLRLAGNKRLKIYGLNINIGLDERISRIYYSGYYDHLLRMRDVDSSARKSFSQLTGQDLKIENYFTWKRFWLLAGGLVISGLMFLIGYVKDNSLELFGAIIGVISLLCLIFGLLGL